MKRKNEEKEIVCSKYCCARSSLSKQTQSFVEQKTCSATGNCQPQVIENNNNQTKDTTWNMNSSCLCQTPVSSFLYAFFLLKGFSPYSCCFFFLKWKKNASGACAVLIWLLYSVYLLANGAVTTTIAKYNNVFGLFHREKHQMKTCFMCSSLSVFTFYFSFACFFALAINAQEYSHKWTQ